MRQQQFHDLGMVLDDRVVQRRRAGLEVARVHVGVVFDQQLDDAAVSVPGRVVQGHRAQRVAKIGIGAGVKERTRARGVVGFDSFMQVVRAGRTGEQRGRHQEAQKFMA